MKLRGWLLRGVGGAVLGIGFAATTSLAQEKPLPDAQIESNVLKALAGVPELADQEIGTTTVYGVVTLSGSVRDEASRDKAEQVVAKTVGVKKVVDEMVIGAPTETATTGGSQSPQNMDQNAEGNNPAMQQTSPEQGQTQPQPQVPAPVQQSQGAPQQYPANPGYPNQYPNQYPSQGYPGQPPSQYPSQGYPNQYPNQYPTQGYPGQYPSQSPNQGYPNQYPQYPSQSYPPARQPYRVQQAGQPVVVPAGTVVRVRINQAMDSRRTQPGTAFDGVVISDVLAGGAIAIPRGAMVQGQVADTHPGGDLRGRGGLALVLMQVILEGHPYPLATDAWSHEGYDKTGQTVGNTIGLGAVGATIGAIAGGGPGALAGAGIGAVAGLGVSAASHNGEATVPSEAILDFRLSQQAALMTVSQAELDRLGAGLPPPQGPQQMRRRYYPPPPPPPPGYGPAVYYPYPYPYYYPYYR